MEDRQIIRLMRENPSEGLREALEKYGGLVRLVASRLLDTPQDVEECVADAFVNVWRGAERIRSDRLKGYLLCAARNVAINRYHQLKRQSAVLLGDSDPADGTDLALEVAGREETELLQQLIMRLGEPDREILIRKYFLFERAREIAARLGLEETQVKSRLYRARQRLKKALEERGITYDGT